MLLIGRTAAVPAASGGITPADAAPGEDPQAIVVEVPRVVTIPIRVVPSLGVAGEERDRDHGAAGDSAPRTTAATGSDLRLPLLAGGLLVVLGAVVTALGRRPLRARHPR